MSRNENSFNFYRLYDVYNLRYLAGFRSSIFRNWKSCRFENHLNVRDNKSFGICYDSLSIQSQGIKFN